MTTALHAIGRPKRYLSAGRKQELSRQMFAVKHFTGQTSEDFLRLLPSRRLNSHHCVSSRLCRRIGDENWTLTGQRHDCSLRWKDKNYAALLWSTIMCLPRYCSQHSLCSDTFVCCRNCRCNASIVVGETKCVSRRRLRCRLHERFSDLTETAAVRPVQLVSCTVTTTSK